MSFRSITCVFLLIPAMSIIPTYSVADEDDGRNTIVLRPKERNMMLEDMCHYLIGIKRITEAIAEVP